MHGSGSHKYIQGKGVTLWARCDGDPGQPCIILIAGANASHLMWPDEFCALLVSEGFFVIRYDHRDTGKSSKFDFVSRSYTLADLSDDIIAVLDGFGVRRAHVVGLSMGGSLTQAVLLSHPERFLSATIMLTAALDVDFPGNISRVYTGEPEPHGLPLPQREVLEQLSKRNTPAESEEEELERRVCEWMALSGPLAALNPEEFRTWEARAMAHGGTFRQPVNHALAQPIPLEQGAKLSQVHVPTLVIQGGQDPLNPPPHGRHLAELIPSARLLEIPELGHSLPSSLHPKIVEAIVGHAHRSASAPPFGA
ncbi:MAG: alpha/beta hydrolase [Verminephrobacter sp.]|nr:alpha/beta hydrolase [Verminephrobacter sp.]